MLTFVKHTLFQTDKALEICLFQSTNCVVNDGSTRQISSAVLNLLISEGVGCHISCN